MRWVMWLPESSSRSSARLSWLRLYVTPIRRRERIGSGRAVRTVTAAAVIAAFLDLFRDHIPQMLARIFGNPLKQLRGLHSGIFTDYIAYMMFGITAYTAYRLAAAR